MGPFGYGLYWDHNFGNYPYHSITHLVFKRLGAKNPKPDVPLYELESKLLHWGYVGEDIGEYCKGF